MSNFETIVTNSSKPGFPKQEFLAMEKTGLGHNYSPESLDGALSVNPLGIMAFAAMSVDMENMLGVSYLYPRRLDGNPEDKVAVVGENGLKLVTIENAFRDKFKIEKDKPVYEIELGGSFVLPEAQGNGIYKDLFNARLDAVIEMAKTGKTFLTDKGEPVSADDIYITLCSKGDKSDNPALEILKKQGNISYEELSAVGSIETEDIGAARPESRATAYMAETLGMDLVAASSNNLGPVYAIKLKELLKQKDEKTKWGLPGPAILIDSQSSPALKGIEPEQRYYRLYLMGKKEDVAITDYPVDQAYISYLKNVLKIPVPHFIQIPQAGGQTLTENILAQPKVMDWVKKLAGAGYKMQFFNLNGDELNVAESLANPTFIQNLEFVAHLGTKDGFREFCSAYGIPMPEGEICLSEPDIETAVKHLDSDVIIKSSKGTGGKELGSNVILSKSEMAADPDAIVNAIEKLMPASPPYVVEKKLDLPEASLHIFINDDGSVYIEPTLFGQLAHDQSYNGGYFPHDFPAALSEKIIALAQEKIVPALKAHGATGFHCMDFLYDTGKTEFYFIEDNTRPGALDFIHHFISKTVDSNFRGQDYAWYHKMIPLKDIGLEKVSFEEIYSVIGDMLTPEGAGFGLLSNPDVLQYGYQLHLSAVAVGPGKTKDDAVKVYNLIVDRLKEHYGHK